MLHQDALPPQILLLGDIFDFLVGDIPESVQKNREAIDKINRLAEKTDVFYFEGNHDFNLARVFPGARVFPREAQPVLFENEGETVLISHGDLGFGRGHEIYMSIIRNHAVLVLLDRLDTYLLGRKIFHRLETWLQEKHICCEFDAFDLFIRRRIGRLKTHHAKWLVEGHFHQGKSLKSGKLNYLNISAFACDSSYFCVELNSTENLLSKGFYKES